HAENAHEVAERSAVLSQAHLSELTSALSAIRPRPGIFDPRFVRRLEAKEVIEAKGHRAKIAAVREDIGDMLAKTRSAPAIMVFCASTERYEQPSPAVASLAALERALDRNEPSINPTLLYAYAALREGVPFANATPNVAIETPAMQELAELMRLPIVGK